MARFLTRYRITPEFYHELRIKVLTGKVVTAIKEFRDATETSLMEARSAVLSEFGLENKLSQDMLLYSAIQRIENCEGINNLPVSGDIGILLEFAREQLFNGLRSRIGKNEG